MGVASTDASVFGFTDFLVDFVETAGLVFSGASADSVFGLADFLVDFADSAGLIFSDTSADSSFNLDFAGFVSFTGAFFPSVSGVFFIFFVSLRKRPVTFAFADFFSSFFSQPASFSAPSTDSSSFS